MRLLSRSSVAKKLDISEKTLDRWVDAGKFPGPTHGVPEQSSERWAKGIVDLWIAGQIIPAKQVSREPVKPKTPRTTADNPGQIDPEDGT